MQPPFQSPPGEPPGTPPSTQLSPAELAYAAGLLDGEGCVHISRQRYPNRSDTYRLGVHLAQNDLDTLEYFREAAGVHAPIYKTRLAHNHRRQCYTLNYTGQKAVELIERLSPYLRRKRREAEAALAFWTEGRVGSSACGRRVPENIAQIRVYYFELLKKLK